jgi:3-phosphoshikimate 1-carboxyvinyltransferase
MNFFVEPSLAHSATVSVPGDKSVSHRALMLGGIAEGETTISGFLAGEDCIATLDAMSAMGVAIEQPESGLLLVQGVGLRGLTAPTTALDLGNSGTAMRLLAGLLSGQLFRSILTGDESLQGRPMQRVISPLTSMGASIESNSGLPPLRITGRFPLTAINYSMPVASAQVKSAVLLAGLYAEGKTSVIEPAVTRDHTERMLASMGAAIEASGGNISIQGAQRLHGCAISVPADLSSAAFVMLAALLATDAEIVIEDVGINPTRTGVIDILRSMGGEIHLENQRWFGEEPVANIRVRSSVLHGRIVDPALVSLAIDEFPVLFVAAGAAQGTTEFSGLAELRVKESDRIASMVNGLRTLGIIVDEFEDGATIHGGSFGGGVVASHGDHRVAMSFAVAGSIADAPVTVTDVAAVDTSFPGFCDCMSALGISIHLQGGLDT